MGDAIGQRKPKTKLPLPLNSLRERINDKDKRRRKGMALRQKTMSKMGMRRKIFDKLS